MTKEQYIELLERLGFYSRNRQRARQTIANTVHVGRVLRHERTDLPVIYFNYTRKDGVYFVVHREDAGRFPPSLWEVVPSRKGTDNTPLYQTLVIRPGREREAFTQLLS